MKEKIEFLKEIHAHLEQRIQFVDQKTSILIGVLSFIIGGVFIEFLIGFFGVSEQLSFYDIEYLSAIWLSGNIVFSLVILLHLIWTIKPSSRAKFPKYEIDNYMMWFSKRDFTEEGRAKFDVQMDRLSDKDIYENYKKIVYTSKFLLSKKYHTYRRAIDLMKLLIVFDSVVISLVLITKLISVLH